MKELDALVEKVRMGLVSRTEILSQLKRVDNALEDGYMELPLDVDKVPIHIGDTMEYSGEPTTLTVEGFGMRSNGAVYVLAGSEEYEDYMPDGAVSVNAIRHHTEMTVEEILAKVAEVGRDAEEQYEVDVAIERYAQMLSVR